MAIIHDLLRHLQFSEVQQWFNCPTCGKKTKTAKTAEECDQRHRVQLQGWYGNLFFCSLLFPPLMIGMISNVSEDF